MGVEGSGLGGLQAHTQGGELKGLAWGGVSTPTPRGRSPGPHLGDNLACTEADTPQQTTTAAGGTHPIGMHSCYRIFFIKDHEFQYFSRFTVIFKGFPGSVGTLPCLMYLTRIYCHYVNLIACTKRSIQGSNFKYCVQNLFHYGKSRVSSEN